MSIFAFVLAGIIFAWPGIVIFVAIVTVWWACQPNPES